MKKILRCADCQLPYRDFGIDLVLPDQQWEVLVPQGGAVLCANCIGRRAKKFGGTCILAWIDSLVHSKVAERPASYRKFHRICSNDL